MCVLENPPLAEGEECHAVASGDCWLFPPKLCPHLAADGAR